MKAGSKRILAIDYGTVWCGTAVSDPLGLIARGLETIPRPGSNAPVIARIQEIIDEYEIGTIVLGIPKRSDGRPGEKEREVKKFSKELEKATGLRPVWRDERFSTVRAEQIMHQTGVKEGRRKEIVDQVAAEVILQSYLDESPL